jgi:hypothetical protein
MRSFAEQEKPGAQPGSPKYVNVFKQSGSFKITSRQFATLFDDVKTDTLTFDQCVHTGALNRASMHEYVLVPAFRRNEPEPFGSVKKFYSSYSHAWPPYQKIRKAGQNEDRGSSLSDIAAKRKRFIFNMKLMNRNLAN